VVMKPKGYREYTFFCRRSVGRYGALFTVSNLTIR
jgi:hypothetical protein